MIKTLELQQQKTTVVRSLDVLAPLIKQDIAKGNDAYRAAGFKLIEAKERALQESILWSDWLRENFAQKQRWATILMHFAQESRTHESLEDFRRRTTPSHAAYAAARSLPAEIRRIMAGLSVDIDELSGDDMSEKKEVGLMRSLAAKVIDAGYRVMALKLHPDKGGSNEAMKRLNEVRSILKLEAKSGKAFIQ